MIDNLEIDAIMESTAVVVREYVSAEVAKLTTQIEERGNRILAEALGRIKEIPAGPQGKDAEPVDFARVVGEVLQHIPVPKNGVDGKDGTSVSVDAVHDLIRIEAGKAVAALPHAKDGASGKDAEPVHPDTLRLLVLDEVQKAVAVIPKAKDGVDGTAGRDATQIEILPMIDEAKSYPRGTHALYKGGEIRATRKTDPIVDGLYESGWEVTREGIAAIVEIPSDDPRDMLLQIRHTSGFVTSINRHFPLPVYEQIWTDATDYKRGAMVSRGGSVWHCNVSGTKAVPSETPATKDWTLCVKRGGEGKAADMDAVRLMVASEVAKAVAALPKPRDGRDLTQFDPSTGKKW